MTEKEELVKKISLLINAMGDMHDKLLGCRVAPLIRGRLEPFDELVQEARVVLNNALEELDGIVLDLTEEIKKEKQITADNFLSLLEAGGASIIRRKK